MIAVLGVISSSSYSVGQEKSATPHPDTAAAAYDSAYIACQKLDRPGAMSCECFQQLNDRRDAELNAVYKRALAELDQMGRDLTAEQGGHLRIDEKDRPPTYFQDQLKDAQRKWVAFRDAECNSVSSQYVFAATGAMSCASSNLCSALLTKHRSDELEANYELNDGPPMPASNSQPASKTQTYKNTTYGFQFDYPVAMSPGPGSYGNLKVQIVQLQIPQSYPKTNFVDAAFSVSASPAKTLVDCLASSAPANGDGFKTKTIINGADFYLTSGDDRGMGNIYQSKVYRAFAGNQTCIELDETLHTSNIGMYAPGTVTEVDQGPIWKTLDQVTSTFKFIK
jgi:uncharacterized protein YecT (DUF1311 family)